MGLDEPVMGLEWGVPVMGCTSDGVPVMGCTSDGGVPVMGLEWGCTSDGMYQ